MVATERGVVKKWDDAKGFGFIKPSDGKNPDIFMHISSIRRGLTRRPLPGDVVYYRVEMDANSGKQRACDVSIVVAIEDDAELERRAAVREAARARPWLGCSLLSALPFVLSGYLWLVEGNRIPLFAYTGVSLVTFLMYRVDKRAAQTGQWRIAEAKLHVAELLCGWPGALVAQCWLRHKSSKFSYQAIFRLIVFFHLVVWGDQLLAQGKTRMGVWQRLVSHAEKRR